MIRSTALHGQRNDVAGALIGFFFGFCLDITKHDGRVMAGIPFNVAEKYFLCLVHRQTGNGLKLFQLLVVKLLDGCFGFFSFLYLFIELLLTLLNAVYLFIQSFFPLKEPALVALKLVAALS